MPRLLQQLEPYFPLRGRWLSYAFLLLFAVALVAVGSVERLIPGLVTWRWEDVGGFP